jgi:hypothetical protein
LDDKKKVAGTPTCIAVALPVYYGLLPDDVVQLLPQLPACSAQHPCGLNCLVGAVFTFACHRYGWFFVVNCRVPCACRLFSFG